MSVDKRIKSTHLLRIHVLLPKNESRLNHFHSGQLFRVGIAVGATPEKLPKFIRQAGETMAHTNYFDLYLASNTI